MMEKTEEKQSLQPDHRASRRLVDPVVMWFFEVFSLIFQ